MNKFDHTVEPVDGYHPEYKYLAFFEIEEHHSMYILISEAKEGSELLVSHDDLIQMFDFDCIDNGFGYASDECLDLFADES